ncbi:hypothetical protein AEB_P2503 [Altererythrobacter sp. B11]|uniref:hypothetical protein n=1 Tax=Altererythrobacter sp. B11 TaxID=2060312 RepID=UPI000DC729CF|nr:hypothetical protein [Altererythrobacter sp. B11]BBC73371.1 hypothetical protein AEB_P2503 [Altererythrobacter sp. B11]
MSYPILISAISISPMKLRVDGWAVLANAHDGAYTIAWFLDYAEASAWAEQRAEAAECPFSDGTSEAAG